VAGRSSSPHRQDEKDGAGAEVKGEPPADAHRELDRRRERRAGPAHGSPAPGRGERRRGLACPPAAGSPRRGRTTAVGAGPALGSGRKGGEPTERGPRRRGARESHDGKAVGRPRPQRAASALGARSPRTHHGRRRNREEWKGGATGITDRGSVRAEVAAEGREATRLVTGAGAAFFVGPTVEKVVPVSGT
jgi:hypothetical protein